jgi:hypothetical protein
MMLKPRIASGPEPGAVEAARSRDIVSNFDKGLMQVRCVSGPASPPKILRIGIRAPSLFVWPEATAPRNGLLLSLLLHSAVVPVLFVLPILVPIRSFIAADADKYSDSDLPADPQPIFFPLLPKTAEADSSTEIKRAVGAAAQQLIPVPLKPDYAGNQEVVSNPPDAIHGVQTIRRPDLVRPPTMTYPLRLPSMVIRPALALEAPVPPRLERPLLTNHSETLTFAANEPAPPKPRFAIDAKSLSLAPSKREVPKTADVSGPSLPVISAAADPEAMPLKSIIVINAVMIPPSELVIPEAEMNSQFVVGPSRDATAEIEQRTTAGARDSDPGEDSSRSSVEDGAASGAEHPDSLAGRAKSGSLNAELRTGSRSRLGSAANSTVATGENKGLASISISGGVPGRSGRALATNSTPRAFYALTIISGGNSGGASRDLGVFARADTVYTIYIPMTEVGGGPDWPMQYALMSPAQNSLPNALLTPPVVLKKKPATLAATYLKANSGPAFVTGMIDENGKLKDLRAVRTMDAKAQAAIRSLEQWEFQPAQLGGKPVPSKILIGVSVMPAQEDGKQL